MRGDKIYLGYVTNPEYKGRTYLTKHSWDCGWYWGFGYLGNARCHWHFDALLKGDHTDVNKVFDKPWLTQDQWWIIRDLFITAYALKAAAEVYRYGGHQTSKADPYRIKSSRKAASLNRDLEKVLNNIWTLLSDWRAAHEGKERKVV